MGVVYLTPKPKADPYSGQSTGEDWSAPNRTTAPAAFVLSSRSSSPRDATRDAVELAWTLYVPEGEQPPGRSDRVEFDGVVFVQDGQAIRETNPFTGWSPYAQVSLTRVEG